MDVKFDVILGSVREADLTQIDRDKLDQSMKGFLGVYATYAQFVSVHPTGNIGEYAFLNDTGTYWDWNAVTSAWEDTHSAIASYTKGEVDNLLAYKQNITDNTLATTAKTVPGAINELNTTKQNSASLETDVAAAGFIQKNIAGSEAKLWTEKGTLLELMDSSGKVLAAKLPSYVDDVVEYNQYEDLPRPGETGKIYVIKTGTYANRTFRWSGTDYIEISPSLVIGTVAGTAFDGARGLAVENGKLNANLGAAQAGKYLYVQADGSVGFNTIPTLNWGNITGNISAQTDLQNALNAKFNANQGTSHAGDYLKVQTDGSIGFAGGSTVTVNWGSINGSLSNQTDLVNALNLKITEPSGGMAGQYLQKTATGTKWATVAGGVESVNTKTGAVTLYGADISVSSTDATTVTAAIAAKSTVALSATGSSTTEAKYITLNGTEWKLAGGVESVNAKTGAVTLYGADIPVSSIDATKIDAALGLKQNITDNTFSTSSKTVPGAINELNLTKVTAIAGKGLSTNDFVAANYYTAATVDAKISSMSGTFRGNFASKALLDAYAGAKANNDYAIVDADETHSNQKWRYVYNGTAWMAEYQITGGGAQWGMITGTISVQADLMSKFGEYYTKPEINAMISSGSAAFRGNFPTYMALMNYSGTKETGDYAVVLADEMHSNECWRYKYMVSVWMAEYRINESAMTEAQMAALNSGATAAIIGSISSKITAPDGGTAGQLLMKTESGYAWDDGSRVFTDVSVFPSGSYDENTIYRKLQSDFIAEYDLTADKKGIGWVVTATGITNSTIGETVTFAEMMAGWESLYRNYFIEVSRSTTADHIVRYFKTDLIIGIKRNADYTENMTCDLRHAKDGALYKISGGGSAAIWGNISGTLNDQTDLQNALAEKEHIIQYEVMPTAGAEFANKVIQYTGTGAFYKCIETAGVYSWKKLDLGDDLPLVDSMAEAETDKPAVYNGETTEDFEYGHLYKYEEAFVQKFTWTAGSSTYIQYARTVPGTGERVRLYTTSDCVTPTTYKTDGGSVFVNDEAEVFGSVSGTEQVEGHLWNEVYPASSITVDDTMSSTSTNPVQNKVIKGVVDGKEPVFRYSTMPTASLSYSGKIVQYIGETTADYIKASYYECVEDQSNPGNYKWNLLGGAAAYINSIELAGDKSSYDLKILWTGTKAQYDALTTKNQNTIYATTDDGTAPVNTYYTKEEVDSLLYNKQATIDTSLTTQNKGIIGAINELFGDVRALAGVVSIEVVETAPIVPANNTIYFIGATHPYQVRLYTNNAGWKDLGSTDIDLSDYQQKNVIIAGFTATTVEGILAEIATMMGNKQKKITISTSDPSGGVDGDVWLKVN